MLSVRNIHFGLLGMILGVAAAYIFGTYQVEARRSAAAAALIASAAADPDGHSEVSEEEMLMLFDEALALEPDNQALNIRYANFLFNLQRFGAAVDVYRRVLENNPEDSKTRADMATSLYNMGRLDEALAQYERVLASDPSNLLALRNVAIAQLEALGDVSAAEATIRLIEGIDPEYPGLSLLRQRLAAASPGPG